MQRILALLEAFIKDAEEARSGLRTEIIDCSCSVVDDKLGTVS